MADPFSTKKKATEPQAHEKTHEKTRGKTRGQPRSRIALASEKILAEAERTLAGDAPPVTLRPGPADEDIAMPGLEAGLSPEERRELAEIVDAQNRTLLCMPPREAMRQKLRPRLAAIVLRGPGDTVVLRKHCGDDKNRLGLWDLYAGPVRPGEAAADAAERILAEAAGLAGLHPRPLPFPAGLECAWASLELFAAELRPGQYPEAAPRDLLPLDVDELAGLLRDVREIFTPELLFAADHNALFAKRPEKAGGAAIE